MSTKLALALSLLLFAAFCYYCINHHSAAMTGAATLPAATTATAPPTFSALINGGKVTLNGTLPTEAAKAAVINRANELYGTGNYLDNLRVGNVTNPNWVASLPGVLPLLNLKDRMALNGGMAIDNGEINLTGQVPTVETKRGIYEAVMKNMAPVRVNDLMVVNAGPALSEKGLEAQNIVNKELLGKIIEFDTGKATIRQGANGTDILNNVADIFTKYPDLAFEVGGHTDNVGKPASNKSLSQARANAVKAYLASKGIAATRMTALGYGDTKPIGDNATEEGKQRNRRIEFGVRELKATVTETPKK
jgi:OOP family OmpA-OmpF porin